MEKSIKRKTSKNKLKNDQQCLNPYINDENEEEVVDHSFDNEEINVDIENETIEENAEEEALFSGTEDYNFKVYEVDNYSNIEEKLFTKKDQWGPQNIPENRENPIEFFELFYTELLMKEILLQTNNYRNQKLKGEKNKNDSTEIHISEIYSFIAVHIMMGIQTNSDHRDHWKQDKILGSKFHKWIGIGKFERVAKYLHLADNELKDENPLYKLKPLLSMNLE